MTWTRTRMWSNNKWSQKLTRVEKVSTTPTMIKEVVFMRHTLVTIIYSIEYKSMRHIDLLLLVGLFILIMLTFVGC